MLYRRRSIRINRKETFERVIHRSNSLTQCYLSGLYHVLNIYQQELCFGHRIHLCISLTLFMISLLNIDKIALSKALPEFCRALDRLIGLREALYVLMAINWMFIFLSWVLYFPIHFQNDYFLDAIPISLTVISSLNWCSWTISFIY